MSDCAQAKMKPQTKAVNVLEKTSEYLRAGLLKKQPAWYHVVGSHPPNKGFIRQPRLTNPSKEQSIKPVYQKKEVFTRKRGIYETRKKAIKRDVYNIPRLAYVEDQLRSLFYEQHPWELSRPKILLENSGDDAKHQDWSKIQQLNKQLDGESVVQRTIYLLNNGEGLSLPEAYEQAKLEFYRLRIEQEVEDQVSKEENEMFGAGYKQSPMEYGAEIEQQFIDKWKIEATEATKVIEARRVSPQSAWGQESAPTEQQ